MTEKDSGDGEQDLKQDNKSPGHHGGQGNQTTAKEVHETTNPSHPAHNPGKAPELIQLFKRFVEQKLEISYTYWS